MSTSSSFKSWKKGRSIRGNAIELADWSSVDPKAIANAIATASMRGGALRLGYTTDGGAYAIGIYHNGEMHTEYCSPREDITRFLELIIEWYELQFVEEDNARNGTGKPSKTK